MSHMSDVSREHELGGDDVKLVHYVIVSIDRDRERRLANGDGYEIVTDAMSGEGFASWRIARYLQQEAPREPEKLAEREKKYLRVCWEVCGRWPRQSLRFEERQLGRLTNIADAIRERNRRKAAGDGGGTGGAAAAGDEREREVLRAIEDLGGSATIGQLQSRIDRPREEIQATLDRLVAAGRLSRTGRGVTARYRPSEAA